MSDFKKPATDEDQPALSQTALRRIGVTRARERILERVGYRGLALRERFDAEQDIRSGPPRRIAAEDSFGVHLECGHTVDAFPDYKGLRRRCPTCRDNGPGLMADGKDDRLLSYAKWRQQGSPPLMCQP